MSCVTLQNSKPDSLLKMEEDCKFDRTPLSGNKDRFSFTMSHKKTLGYVCPALRCSVVIIAAAPTLRHYPVFAFQLQDAETSDQLKCFWIITKPKRGQIQAGERRVRVRLG